MIEGEITSVDKIGLIDDLVTKFSSKMIALRQVQHELIRRDKSDVDINHVFVLFDREQGAKSESEKMGISLHSMIPFKTQGMEWLKERFHKVEHRIISEYLEAPGEFQNEATQIELKKIAKKGISGESK